LLHVLRRRNMARQPRLLAGAHLLRRRPRKMLKKLKLKPKRPGGLPKLNVPVGKMLFSDGAPLSAPSQIWCKLIFTACSRSSLLTLRRYHKRRTSKWRSSSAGSVPPWRWPDLAWTSNASCPLRLRHVLLVLPSAVCFQRRAVPLRRAS